MNYQHCLQIAVGNAVCYSGFRVGQRPGVLFPAYEQVKEDLLIIQEHWQYIRLYSCDNHALTVLDVIEKEKLPIKVILGAFIEAEINNPNCPWGGVYSQEKLSENQNQNLQEVQKLIQLANTYPEIIFAVSVGNEACVSWTDLLVPVDKVINYIEKVKSGVKQPVTFCENYVPWLDILEPLAEVVDFISIHTYPVWENKSIEESMEFTEQNYLSVAKKYPNKLVVITEAGWATQSNGFGIPREHVNQEIQRIRITLKILQENIYKFKNYKE